MKQVVKFAIVIKEILELEENVIVFFGVRTLLNDYSLYSTVLSVTLNWFYIMFVSINEMLLVLWSVPAENLHCEAFS